MTTTRQGLTEAELRTLDGYWRAANYLSAGQIYLMANPLLRQPLRPSPRSTTCCPAWSGGRTTTASRTRTPGSSTM